MCLSSIGSRGSSRELSSIQIDRLHSCVHCSAIVRSASWWKQYSKSSKDIASVLRFVQHAMAEIGSDVCLSNSTWNSSSSCARLEVSIVVEYRMAKQTGLLQNMKTLCKNCQYKMAQHDGLFAEKKV